MPTNYPNSLDTLLNPTASDTLDDALVPHHLQHANANDAIEALQAKVGVDDSAETESLDYLLKNSSSINPGHLHSTMVTPSGTLSLQAAATGINVLTNLSIKNKIVAPEHWLNNLLSGSLNYIPYWNNEVGNGWGSGFTTDFPVEITIDPAERVSYLTTAEDAIAWWDESYSSRTAYPRLYVSSNLKPNGGTTSDTADGLTPNTAVRSIGTALAKSDGIYGNTITAAVASGTTLTITTSGNHGFSVGSVFTATPLVGATVTMTGIADAGGTMHTVTSVLSATQFTVTATTANTYSANSAGICKPRWIIILSQGLDFKFNRTANIGGPWTISTGYSGDICANTIISTDEGIVETTTRAMSSMEFGDTQSWTRSGSSNAWNCTFTNTIGSTNSTSVNIWAQGVVDSYGMGRKLVGVTSLNAVTSGLYTYWCESSTKIWVNINSGAVAPTGIEIFRTSNNGFKGNNPYKLFVMNMRFKGGTNAFRYGSSHWANNEYDPKVVFYNCIFQNSNSAGNGFKSEIPHKIHLIKCTAQYNDADGFNWRRSKNVKIGCIGRWNGYLSTSQTESSINYATSASFGTNQGETTHANAQTISIASEYYQNGGQGVGQTGTLSGASGATGTADTYSVLIGCYIYNSLGIVGTGKGNRDVYFGSDAADRLVMLYTKFESPAGVASTTTAGGNNNVRIENGALFTNRAFSACEISSGKLVVKDMYERSSSATTEIATP